jgi:hypothetical protein
MNETPPGCGQRDRRASPPATAVLIGAERAAVPRVKDGERRRIVAETGEQGEELGVIRREG